MTVWYFTASGNSKETKTNRTVSPIALNVTWSTAKKHTAFYIFCIIFEFNGFFWVHEKYCKYFSTIRYDFILKLKIKSVDVFVESLLHAKYMHNHNEYFYTNAIHKHWLRFKIINGVIQINPPDTPFLHKQRNLVSYEMRKPRKKVQKKIRWLQFEIDKLFPKFFFLRLSPSLFSLFSVVPIDYNIQKG